ncbi:hypothetical protein FOZ62_002224 [Perkinsus olseni]|uniref:Uncharacterized protein n=1 Tax=Perkinsus olseni TaxID=32597 RepID=A0A7J6SLX8_PEROL|nr:hypothetical protein FOZ62_002224 [Perkinsus olseni]
MASRVGLGISNGPDVAAFGATGLSVFVFHAVITAMLSTVPNATNIDLNGSDVCSAMAADAEGLCDSVQSGPRCAGLSIGNGKGPLAVVGGLLQRSVLEEAGLDEESTLRSLARHLSSMLQLFDFNEVISRRSSESFRRGRWAPGSEEIVGGVGFKRTSNSVSFDANLTITGLRINGNGRLLVRAYSGKDILWSAGRLGGSVKDLMVDATSLASPLAGAADGHAVDKLEFFGGGTDDVVEMSAVTRGPGFDPSGLHNLFIVLDPWNKRSVLWRGRLASTAPYVDYNTVLTEGLQWATTERPQGRDVRTSRLLFSASLLDRVMARCSGAVSGENTTLEGWWEGLVQWVGEESTASWSRKYHKSFDAAVDAAVSSYTGPGADFVIDQLVGFDMEDSAECEGRVGRAQVEKARRLLWRLRDDFEGLGGLEEPLSVHWSRETIGGKGPGSGRGAVQYSEGDVVAWVNELIAQVLSPERQGPV